MCRVAYDRKCRLDHRGNDTGISLHVPFPVLKQYQDMNLQKNGRSIRIAHLYSQGKGHTIKTEFYRDSNPNSKSELKEKNKW